MKTQIKEDLYEKFTKYEVARILGARSLQLAMGAPVLLNLTKDEERDLNYDTLRIAEKELGAGVLPITVRRPLPKKSQKTVKKLSTEEIKEKLKKQEEIQKKDISSDKEIIDEEEKEEKEIAEEGEIMEMAQPDDEVSDDEDSGEEEF